jgi:hypothetical protein
VFSTPEKSYKAVFPCRHTRSFVNLDSTSFCCRWVGEGEKIVKALFAVAAEKVRQYGKLDIAFKPRYK